MGKEIAIRDLTFSYSGRGDQISHVTLDIRAGEVIVLTGPSGSGKSSLTRVINGLIPYFYEGELSGQIRVGDKPLEEIHSWERGKLVGNVFQDPRSQFFANEVAGEIAFGCENYGYTHEEIQSHVLQAAQYNKIEDLLDHSLHTLSYGMRQKVAIASAQAIEPEIYVMDEPSANLDIESTYRFGDIIRNLKAQGKTIVIAEHRLYYLMDVADRFFCIQHGAIVREFSREEMKSLPSAEVHTLGLRTPDLYQMAFQQMPSAATDEVVLETQGLHKAFDGTVVAEHLDFVCHRGEIVGIIGPNGTGKSTFGRIFAGLLKENSGEVFLFGHKTRPRERMGKVWYIPQDLDSQLFGEDLVDELTTGAPTDEKRNARARTILKALELEEYAEQHPATLSGGQKQRLALGVALMHDAPIIILDEPISGVLNKIMYISESFTQIDGNVERMEEVLSIPVLQNQDVGAREQGHSIEFDHVSFSYDTGTSVKALNDVSFIARQGEVTAIVGPSGGGKSTIANLISRFWDVTEGCIRIGGVDIRKIPQAELMRQVSFVFQDTFLFKQSILDNIRMGNPTASEAQVIEAAKAAQCHDFIEKLPDGYHTMIGASGIRLSGGERQRIAIARAIIKDAPIIVLDEATAFSDPENEYLIQKAFEKLIQNKTVIMIAHRLSTIRNADQILVMEHGQLIEQGTHDTLLERQGKYTQMWNSYMESISWKIRAGKGGAIE